mmetsp:Transcript_30445/g.90237  ORF Transcript_30445/g.90237 Transcript_30445/m.90237 type:complete len:207 (-) Transcript_30445:2728-3348(-)
MGATPQAPLCPARAAADTCGQHEHAGQQEHAGQPGGRPALLQRTACYGWQPRRGHARLTLNWSCSLGKQAAAQHHGKAYSTGEARECGAGRPRSVRHRRSVAVLPLPECRGGPPWRRVGTTGARHGSAQGRQDRRRRQQRRQRERIMRCGSLGQCRVCGHPQRCELSDANAANVAEPPRQPAEPGCLPEADAGAARRAADATSRRS